LIKQIIYRRLVMPYTIDRIKSVKGTHFTGALAPGAQEYEDLDFPDSYKQTGIQKLKVHRAVIAVDLTNTTTVVPFYINFWGTDAATLATDPDLDYFQGRIEFSEADLEQVGSSGLYRATRDLTDNPINYEDQDLSGELHVSLENTDASTTFHASDTISITFFVEPIL